MGSQSARNEGFRMLGEFVCEAIVEPSAMPASPTNAVGKRAENEGIAPAGNVPPATPTEPDKGKPGSPTEEAE